MNPRICLISETLCPPFDEGMKNFALALSRHLHDRYEFLGISNHASTPTTYGIEYVPFGKRLISRALCARLHAFQPDHIIYVPFAAATATSFVRQHLLRSACPSAVVSMVSLQHRELSWFGRLAVSVCFKDHLYVLSKGAADIYARLGITAGLIAAGVDTDRFHPVSQGAKLALRGKYDIPTDAYVVLHAGHIKRPRNLMPLAKLGRRDELFVLIVGSTSSDQDPVVEQELLQAGAHVWTHYLEHIEELYQMADAYVFPVVTEYGAIDMPLSVLEALACDLPVCATRFGALPDLIPENDALRYIDDVQHLPDMVNTLRTHPPRAGIARDTALAFSWPRVFDAFLQDMGIPTS